jgi:ABC-type Fe3+-hydroxamate transport system substrate-binding protein
MAAAVATRVVSLSPAFTELLFAIGAGDVVVGRTDWCDFPPAARSVPSVGDGIAPNVEAILARRPDAVLVYASGANTAATAQLRAANIAVITLPMDVLDDVPAAARRLGQLTGRPTRADSLARTFAAALDSARAVAADGPVPRVMLLAWDQPPIVIGAGSFQHELVTLAGATNVFEDLPQPSGQVAIETIAARDPDAVLLLDAEAVPTWAARPEWRVVRAVREGLFLPVQGSEFARPSFRALDAVRMLRAAFATLPR